MRRLALVLAMFAARSAAASPVERCRDLSAMPYAKLADKAREKIYAHPWEDARRWPVYVVTVMLARAPHLARAILADCPGVTQIDEPVAIDARRFTAQVEIKVASFAALTRILQLPAVTSVYVRDPTAPRPPPPAPRFPR